MKKLSHLAAVEVLSLPFTATIAGDDAQVTRVKAQIEKRFADADGDGKLSRDEARKMLRVAQLFDRATRHRPATSRRSRSCAR